MLFFLRRSRVWEICDFSFIGKIIKIEIDDLLRNFLHVKFVLLFPINVRCSHAPKMKCCLTRKMPCTIQHSLIESHSALFALSLSSSSFSSQFQFTALRVQCKSNHFHRRLFCAASTLVVFIGFSLFSLLGISIAIYLLHVI